MHHFERRFEEIYSISRPARREVVKKMMDLITVLKDENEKDGMKEIYCQFQNIQSDKENAENYVKKRLEFEIFQNRPMYEMFECSS